MLHSGAPERGLKARDYILDLLVFVLTGEKYVGAGFSLRGRTKFGSQKGDRRRRGRLKARAYFPRPFFARNSRIIE